MRRYPSRADRLVTPAFLATAASVVLMGCSSDSEPPPESVSQPSVTTGSAPGGVGVSPGGVTTSVDAPAESTEEEYFQACLAARVWIDGHGGDPNAQIEPYLAMVQSSDSSGPGTFDTPWSQLAPARQSAVIVAVEAAADAACG